MSNEAGSSTSNKGDTTRPASAAVELAALRSPSRISIVVPSSPSLTAAAPPSTALDAPERRLSATSPSPSPISPTSDAASPPPPAAIYRHATASRRNITPISILSPPSSTAFSPGASSSIFSSTVGPTADEIPMLPSTSRTTFAPSGELLIDGLGVDGRDLRKGEMGWAEPFSPILLTSPITRRFSTRPNLDPVIGSLPAASTSVIGIGAGASSPVYISPPAANACGSGACIPDNYGACGRTGCQSGDAELLRGSVGQITIYDIIERRTCRPISLQDLRNHLLAQRANYKADPNAAFGKESQLPDLGLLGSASKQASDSSVPDWNSDERDQEKTLTNSLPSVPTPGRKATRSSSGILKGKRNKHAGSATTGDEVDALDFVAVFNRYNRRFQALPKMQKLRSPHPGVFATPADDPAPLRARGDGDGAVTIEIAVRPGLHSGRGRIDSQATNSGSTDHVRKEITLFPSTQPLRQQFDEILHRFLGRVGAAASELGSKADVEKDELLEGADEKGGDSRKDTPSSSRLRWMIDIGLLSEEQVALALAEAEVTSHPQVLAPLADKIATYLNDHIVPEFLSGSTRNLSKGTQLGRLAIGIFCTVLAILFTILLCINPSPFRGRTTEQNPNPDVSRWWRLLTAPLWCAGIGYVLAAWTGVCVWLTIRGNHEPGDDDGASISEMDWEAMMMEEDTDRMDGGASLGRVFSSNDPALPWKRPDRKSLMAPELENLLRRFLFLKPLPVAGSATAGKSTLTLAMGQAEMNGSSSMRTKPNITFSAVQWTSSSLPIQHLKDSLDGRASPALSRSASMSGPGCLSNGTKLEPLNESESVTFDRAISPSSALSSKIGGGAVPVMSSIGQVASALPGCGADDAGNMVAPVTPTMPSFPGSFTSPTSLSPTGRLSTTSAPTHALRPASPGSNSLWRTTSATAMSTGGVSMMPAVSVKSRKFPGFPVAVGMVQTNQPMTTINFTGDPAVSRPPSFSHADAGIAYAASLYNMATCSPRQPAPRRVLSAVWVAVRRWTGFAVNTKPVLDSRVRAAQQRAALQSLVICFTATLVTMIVVTALP
ncbi:hypothetical protein CF319_g3366 [Tilletia indica]|nr:hypothetical protein CF319_g3366 [Tilletia indica]